MKKVVVILVVFALMIGAMIGEIVYVNKFYNGLQADLEAVAVSIDADEEHVDNAQTVAMGDNLVKNWDKGKRTH